MSMLENAVASILLGVEDYQPAAQDDARTLSALRNLTSGLLLLFKVKLQVLSPPDSKESLLKQTVVPGLDADGNHIDGNLLSWAAIGQSRASRPR